MRNKEERARTDRHRQSGRTFVRISASQRSRRQARANGRRGEGADVDRRAPQRREVEHPASRFVQQHGRRRQSHKRPNDPPIALRRPIERSQRAADAFLSSSMFFNPLPLTTDPLSPAQHEAPKAHHRRPILLRSLGSLRALLSRLNHITWRFSEINKSC